MLMFIELLDCTTVESTLGKQENLRNDYMISSMIQNPISYFFAENQKRNFWYFTKGPPVRS